MSSAEQPNERPEESRGAEARDDEPRERERTHPKRVQKNRPFAGRPRSEEVEPGVRAQSSEVGGASHEAPGAEDRPADEHRRAGHADLTFFQASRQPTHVPKNKQADVKVTPLLVFRSIQRPRKVPMSVGTTMSHPSVPTKARLLASERSPSR
jgi:hypothetical protein